MLILFIVGIVLIIAWVLIVIALVKTPVSDGWEEFAGGHVKLYPKNPEAKVIQIETYEEEAYFPDLEPVQSN